MLDTVIELTQDVVNDFEVVKKNKSLRRDQWRPLGETFTCTNEVDKFKLVVPTLGNLFSQQRPKELSSKCYMTLGGLSDNLVLYY